MRPLPKVLDPDHRLLRLCQLNQLSLSSTVSWPGCFRGAIENNHKTIARRGCLFRTPLTRISHAATSKKPLLLAWTTPARHPLESHPRQPRQPHVRKLCEKYGLVDFQTVFATQSSRRQIHADKVQPALSPGPGSRLAPARNAPCHTAWPAWSTISRRCEALTSSPRLKPGDSKDYAKHRP